MKPVGILAGIIFVVAIIVSVDVATSTLSDEAEDEIGGVCAVRRYAFLPDRCESVANTCGGSRQCWPTGEQCDFGLFGACFVWQDDACGCRLTIVLE